MKFERVARQFSQPEPPTALGLAFEMTTFNQSQPIGGKQCAFRKIAKIRDETAYQPTLPKAHPCRVRLRNKGYHWQGVVMHVGGGKKKPLLLSLWLVSRTAAAMPPPSKASPANGQYGKASSSTTGGTYAARSARADRQP